MHFDRHLAFIAGILLTLNACGAAAEDPEVTTGVAGQIVSPVNRLPGAPVEPVRVKVAAYEDDGSGGWNQVKAVAVGEGQFELALPPGTYVVGVLGSDDCQLNETVFRPVEVKQDSVTDVGPASFLCMPQP